MTVYKKVASVGLGALMILGSAAAAFAAPATITTNINVRSGPGTDYRVVDTIRRGDRVDARDCGGGWCYISKPGPDGYVSSRYVDLDRGGPGYGRPVPPRPPVWNDNRPGWNNGPGWNDNRPGWNGPGRPGNGGGWNGPGRPGNGGGWDGPGRPGNDGPGRPGDNNGPGRPGDNNGPGRPDRPEVQPPRPDENGVVCAPGQPRSPRTCSRV